MPSSKKLRTLVHRSRPRVIIILAFACVVALTAGATTDWDNLVLVETVFDGDGGVVEGLRSPRAIATSPDGKHVYVASSIDSSVAAFSRDSARGTLTFVEVEEDGVDGVDGLELASSVTVSPDGKNVYVTGSAPGENKVAVFTRHSGTGGLTLEQVIENGVDLTVDLLRPSSIRISSDGSRAFVASFGSKALVCFLRNPSNGRLLYISSVTDDDPGVSGLGAPTTLAASPDGKHVYVASHDESTVAVLAHNSSTGALSYVGHVQDGAGFVDGIGGSSGVVVSPDGQHVYVPGQTDNAVAIFDRNSTTGALLYQGMVEDGVGGVVGLASPWDITMSNDGKHIYLPGGEQFVPGGLAMFRRSPSTGALTLVDAVLEGVQLADGLTRAVDAAPSPDGRYVYVSVHDDNAVSVFFVSFTGFFKAALPEPTSPLGVESLATRY